MNGNVDDNKVDIEFGNGNNIECDCSSECCFPWNKGKGGCVCPDLSGENIHSEVDAYLAQKQDRDHKSPL